MSTLDPARWRAASAELDTALGLSGDECAAFLAALRARDASLAADVESLLAEHREARETKFLAEGPGMPLTATIDLTRLTPGDPPAAAAGAAFPAGTSFGPYRIVRPLGRGGMGTVYEADEITSGRRVALKVLEERLDDERERERFDREGRLAASLNHPHCVFVFAALEAGSRPAIAMELMRETLADRLKRDGPLPPPQAVDVLLQLVAGLQAAAAVGILHRDIKPSNCFVDADGTVKIGDFGISRSLRPTEETAFSTRTRFAATPAYASPEQLRGAALDVRADIYSLGATLYELLTGHKPFTGTDLMSLLMAVANDLPRAPDTLAGGIPKGLSKVVLRCLAKTPEERFAGYDALAAALEPYASRAASPATVGRRAVAGAIDHVLVASPALLGFVLFSRSFVPTQMASMWQQQLVAVAVPFLYFGIAESFWGTTAGKAFLGLRVVRKDNRQPTPWQAFTRATLYMSALNIPAVAVLVWLMLTEGGSEPALTRLSSGWLPVATSMGPWLLLAGLFTSVRRWNGYAAWHDLASRTRVVERAVMQKPTHARRPAVSVPAVQAAVATRGAFRVLGEALPGMPAGWRPGFDDRLRRDVWIREVAPGTPPLDSVRIAINRPTRLRWLAGRRESGEAWDVFEAVAGVPLAQACTRPRPWADVRWWLLDLARELAAQSAEDGPPLRADRVWVLESGGAKLVDDPAADRDASASGGSGPPPSSTSLLLDVVRTAQGPAPAPWPRCAHQVIDQLRGTQTPADAVLVQTLEGTTRQRATLTRRWRAFHIGLLAAPPALMAVFISFSVTLMVQRVQQVHADVRIAVTGLQHLGLADRGRLTLSDDGREALEVALATRYRSVLTDGRLQRMEYFPLILPPDQQAIVERVLRRRPTAEESRSAGAHPAVKMAVAQALRSPDLPSAWALAIALLGGGLLFVAVPSLIGALAFRGALVRMLGLELVTSDGRPASRLRVLGRATLAWLPVLVAPVVVLAAESMGVRAPAGGPWVWTMSVAVPVTLAGAVVALIRPERGLQDRLAGTWIVPR